MRIKVVPAGYGSVNGSVARTGRRARLSPPDPGGYRCLDCETFVAWGTSHRCEQQRRMSALDRAVTEWLER